MFDRLRIGVRSDSLGLVISQNSRNSRHSESLENYFERVVRNKFSCYSESINVDNIHDVGVGTPDLLYQLWRIPLYELSALVP